MKRVTRSLGQVFLPRKMKSVHCWAWKIKNDFGCGSGKQSALEGVFARLATMADCSSLITHLLTGDVGLLVRRIILALLAVDYKKMIIFVKNCRPTLET